MINKFNIYKLLLFLIAICSILFLLQLMIVYLTENPANNILNTKILYFILKFDLLFILLTILFITMEIIFRIIIHDSVKNIYKSYEATYLIRKFAYIDENESYQSQNSKNRKDKTIRKTNRSINTLVINFKNDTATMISKLPFNNESIKLIKDNFPNIRAELNELDENFLFSDITRKKRRKYQSTAKKIKK
ncbi:hypothetical protein IGL98_003368 [Enterococcus sp. DIV0840]|uniref:hypothetical protein n=1 Tax=unclassified Enterococcus TaxID=2608891 RepID=UPI001A90C0C5|nr:hypothetical protein [Enterococcus sp. DIV0849a]MBO0433114.1 hypothetical protein [Enterococcus sp. DIV0849a]